MLGVQAHAPWIHPGPCTVDLCLRQSNNMREGSDMTQKTQTNCSLKHHFTVCRQWVVYRMWIMILSTIVWLSSCNTHTNTHTHTVLMATFQVNMGQLVPPSFSVSNDLYPKHPDGTGHSPYPLWKQSNQVFLGRPLCWVPSNSIFIHRLSQSASSLCSTCPNHRNLHHLK